MTPMKIEEKILSRMAIVVFFVFIVNAVGSYFYWYTTLWWFDMPMHTIGGVFIGLLGTWLFLQTSWKEKIASFERYIVSILLFTFIVGLGWEIFEYLVNASAFFCGFHSALDTLSDICFDLAGSAIGASYLLRKRYVHFSILSHK